MNTTVHPTYAWSTCSKNGIKALLLSKTNLPRRKQITSGDSLNKSSFFNGEKFYLWQENMRIFIEVMDCGIWKIVKEDSFVLTDEVNGVVVNKYNEDDWTKDKK